MATQCLLPAMANLIWDPQPPQAMLVQLVMGMSISPMRIHMSLLKAILPSMRVIILTMAI